MAFQVKFNRVNKFAVLRTVCKCDEKKRMNKHQESFQGKKKKKKNGVLRKLKHIFPNTYQRIKSICSPAKVGTGCYRF